MVLEEREGSSGRDESLEGIRREGGAVEVRERVEGLGGSGEHRIDKSDSDWFYRRKT